MSHEVSTQQNRNPYFQSISNNDNMSKFSFNPYAKALVTLVATVGTFLFAKTTGILPADWFGEEAGGKVSEESIQNAALQKRELSTSVLWESNLELDNPPEELTLTQSYEKRALSNEIQSSLIEGVEVGRFNITAVYPIVDIVLHGNNAFLSVPLNGLKILDISDPKKPILVAKYDTTALPPVGGIISIFNIDLGNHSAFLANDADGLRVLDITNPYNPYSIGVYKSKPAFPVTKVHVVNNKAYIADITTTSGTAGRFDIVDTNQLKSFFCWNELFRRPYYRYDKIW